jgi:hypothetical protein
MVGLGATRSRRHSGSDHPILHSCTMTDLLDERLQRNLKLLELPAELLLEIAQYLANSELYSLSLLCVRLHHIALPLYLMRHGLACPSNFACDKLSLSGKKFGALPGLRLSLTFAQVKHLEISLGDIPDAKKLDGLGRFLSKPSLLHIGEVTLDFDNVGMHRSGDKLKSRHHGLVIRWGDFLCTMMSSLADKSPETLTLRSGCLQVDGSHNSDMDVIDLAAQPTARHSSFSFKSGDLLNPLKGMLRHSSTSLELTRSSPRIFSGSRKRERPVLRPLQTLRVLCLHSMMVLRQPFLDWAVATANLSPITNLSFNGLTLSAQAWGILLPLLMLPALSNFSIHSTTILFADLALFLARHNQTLTTLGLFKSSLQITPAHPMPLVITPKHPPPPNPPGTPALRLPELKALGASPSYITHFLSMSEDEKTDLFPKLSIIHIEPFKESVLPPGDWGFGGIDLAMYMIARAWQGIGKHLALSIRVHDENEKFADWLETIVADPGSQAEAARARVWRRLQNLQDFVLYGSPLGNRAMELIPPWLALLPSLQAVGFHKRCLGSGGEGGRETDVMIERITRMCTGLKWPPKIHG